jgi:oxygen-independent coproporphyrinogen-3 oxidase
LIYGLPYQTVNSFTKTLETVVSLSPDRLSIFNYAHLPHLFSPQKRISIDTLPLPSEKIAILSATTNYLLEHGYVFIGMDHFAKPDDSLVTSLNEGKLHRNFQGYTTHPGSALIGYGVSSISQYATGYSQNYKTLDAYYSALDDNKLPTWRGCNVSREDDLRKDIIMSLICNFHLSFEDINQKYHIKFNQKFQPELLQLKEFESEGLIRIGENSIDVTSLGRFFIRNICMVFDAYLPHAHEKTYSKVI